MKTIPMVPVKSSALKSVGHFGSTLHVVFADGSKYEYVGVSPQAFASLLKAKSVGQHFLANIRDHYKGRQI